MSALCMCGRLRVGKENLHVAAWGRLQPCVRPVCAVHMTAGRNALRGSGPGQKDAFENALARVGCPDRRIDRLCVTCCSPSQPSHHAEILRRDLVRPDEFTRSRLLKLLLHETEKSRLTRQQLDRIDCHMAQLRELTYRQVELVEKSNLKGRMVERAAKLLALLNDLMANYQTLRRRISPLAE